MLPCVLYEDEHLLVIDKPAGLNTHAPGPCAGEGLYDWLRQREPRWATLAIIHRLDKETSGVIVFSKSSLANRSLTAQFAARTVRKQYVLLTDRQLPRREFTVTSRLRRAGERYVSTRLGGEPAETRFRIVSGGKQAKQLVASAVPGTWPLPAPDCVFVQAEPLTGRTHQIRVHAAEQGFAVLGDTLYGGTPAARVCLHAAELTLAHPATNRTVSFQAPADFAADPRLLLRTRLLEPEQTNACRLVHGASDGWAGWRVDRLGDWLLSQQERALTPPQLVELGRLINAVSARGAYHKRLARDVRKTSLREASPQLVLGEAAPDRFMVREHGLIYELSFNEGYSPGLFFDQRDNRRRLLTGHIAAQFTLSNPQPAPGEVLNTFAYTCAFSLSAAKAGFRTTSLDLSKKYLEWGKRNFTLNHLDPAGHDFIFGDVFDWLKRLAKKGRLFDLILLDPPTFSQSKTGGLFRAEKNYGRLVTLALPLLKGGGVLFASANAATWPADEFIAAVRGPIQQAGRQVLEEHFVPQPPDFPVSRSEPAYLKTLWLRLAPGPS